MEKLPTIKVLSFLKTLTHTRHAEHWYYRTVNFIVFRQLTVSGLLSAWEDFISFSVTGGAEKNTRMWFASEDQ